MASISLRHIFKVYPGNVTAVSDFNLEIDDKEFIILVGPSGCGKSTTPVSYTHLAVYKRQALSRPPQRAERPVLPAHFLCRFLLQEKRKRGRAGGKRRAGGAPRAKRACGQAARFSAPPAGAPRLPGGARTCPTTSRGGCAETHTNTTCSRNI